MTDYFPGGGWTIPTYYFEVLLSSSSCCCLPYPCILILFFAMAALASDVRRLHNDSVLGGGNFNLNTANRLLWGPWVFSRL